MLINGMNLKTYLEFKESHTSSNPLLQKAIDYHNDLDEYVIRNETRIRIDERYAEAAIDYYVTLQVFLELNWKKIAKQLHININNRCEFTEFGKIRDYILEQLSESRENMEEFVEDRDIGSLNGYSILHELIAFFINHDIEYD